MSFLLALIAHRIITLLAGLAMVYMGYRLFRLGVFEHAGDISSSFGPNHLGIKAAAPGTVFAVAGAIIMAISLWKGYSITAPAYFDAKDTGGTSLVVQGGSGGSPTDTQGSRGHLKFPSARLQLPESTVAKINSGRPLTGAERERFERIAQFVLGPEISIAGQGAVSPPESVRRHPN